LGWALLVRQGMVAWMQALPALSPELLGPAPTRSMSNGPMVPEGDLILALVALVLGNRSEVARG
jgi:hypothetical protein